MNHEHDNLTVFPWNKNLETGIERIDEQHKKLVNLLNLLTDSLVRDDASELSSVFDELANYTVYHFKTEEEIWDSYFTDDAWCASHKKTHQSFLPRVNAIREELSDRPLREVIERVVKFLIRWLAFHIIDNDKRMAIALHQMDAGASLESAKRMSDEEMSGATRLLIDTVLTMYDGLSSRTLDLLRERVQRSVVEQQLREANRMLEEMAITDQLTGLYNRRYFETVFKREFLRARRESIPLTVFMLDIDSFKNLNDSYGHLEGDRALKLVAEILIKLCRRPGDYVFRLGGEEFGILVANQVSESIPAFAETLIAGVADLAIPNDVDGKAKHLTVSGGVVSKVPDDADNLDTFMRIADDRLYQAKKLGGNQVVTE